jgi:hypothetical protein
LDKRTPVSNIPVTCTDWLLARAQVGLAFYFCTAIFAMVFALVFFPHHIDAPMLNFVTGVITSLGTLLATIVGFFFGRKTATALPDPSSNGTTMRIDTNAPTDDGPAATIEAKVTPAKTPDFPHPPQEIKQ